MLVHLFFQPTSTLKDIFWSDQTVTTGIMLGQNYGEFFPKNRHISDVELKLGF